MKLCRLIAPDWAMELNPGMPKVIEKELTDKQIKKYNEKQHYNVYYFPNHPQTFTSTKPLDGEDIDVFEYVFVDMDLKDGKYDSKESFIYSIIESNILPTKIVDSGNGMHVYWRVSNLDAKSYMRLQKRLIARFNTDTTIYKILQLMRLPGTLNTKLKDNIIPCTLCFEDDKVYTCEELDKLLPTISKSDELSCAQHFDKTFNKDSKAIDKLLSAKMPPKWGKLIAEVPEARDLFVNISDDRSMNDWRLAQLMHAFQFTKEEAAAVLVNSAKASSRAPHHRVSYAYNIIDKIWTFEILENEEKDKLEMHISVRELLSRTGATPRGQPFRCHPRIDNTEHGFRLGQVIGLVAGSGVGKTAFALNMFLWFAQQNPDYHHFFIPLEQPADEIAARWVTMCGGETSLYDKVQIVSNYAPDGSYRHLSLDEIEDYIKKYQKVTGHKVGCVVIDHIGVLKKGAVKNDMEGLLGICHRMKAFAITTNTLLVMQSQTNREKAGIGDLELDKDAAYGTTGFEWYCDYLITLWQPLKRCHEDPACPTVTAFKFCKVRHKSPKDIIKEDVRYFMLFDSKNERMRDMTQDEKKSFSYFLTQATNKRKLDRKTDILEYKAVPYDVGAVNRKSENESNTVGVRNGV